MVPLPKLEEFMQFLHKVQNVKRVARIPDEKEYRSTAEHTFELAMLCWYIASANKLNLDTEKILMYALAHDLLEGYAGDSYIYDTEALRTKHEREAAALVKIEETFSEFPELIETIHTYERKEDPESVFVYAADKLIDPLNASMESTQSIWKDMRVTYEQLREYKDRKIEPSKDISFYWKLLVEKLEAKKDFYFPH